MTVPEFSTLLTAFRNIFQIVIVIFDVSTISYSPSEEDLKIYQLFKFISTVVLSIAK
jgi:hypothetical protein